MALETKHLDRSELAGCTRFSFYHELLAGISLQRSPGVEANARVQECRGAIHRARLPTYCTLGAVHQLLPRAVAAGPFAPIAVTVVRNAG